MVLFHVTSRKNLESIMKSGLVPQLGKYAREMGETRPSVWMFPCLEDAQEMAPIWLEPFYGADLGFLRIDLPDDFDIETTGSDYELFTTERIAPNRISIIS